MKKVSLHDRINRFPGQHLSVRGNAIFVLLAKKLFHQRRAFCHPIVAPKKHASGKEKIKKSKLRVASDMSEKVFSIPSVSLNDQ